MVIRRNLNLLIITFLLASALVGCSISDWKDQNHVGRYMSLEELASKKREKGAIYDVYGYLTERNGKLYLYPSEKFSTFIDSFKFYYELWIVYPIEKFNEECVNSYVAVSGKGYPYMGRNAFDEIGYIMNLEKENISCHPKEPPKKYFETFLPKS